MASVTVDFQAIFESLPGLHLVLTPNVPVFTIVAVSNAYAQGTSTKRDEILGKGLFEIFPDDDPDDTAGAGVANLTASLVTALGSKTPQAMAIQQQDVPRPGAGGGGLEARHWRPVNTPVLGPDGEVRWIIHSIVDVTAFVRFQEAEQQLRAAEADRQELFDNSMDAVMLVNPVDGRIEMANPAACSLFGGAEEALKGLARTDFIAGSGPRPGGFLERPGRAGQYRDEFTLRRLDGTVFEAEVSTIVVQARPGVVRALMFIRDLTELQAAAEAQRRAQAAAERANQAKSEFLSRMSHELRTPLNSVLGFAQLLELDDLSGRQRDGVDHILRAGRHLLRLVNEVLDITRIEAGILELSLEPVAVAGMLEEVLAMVRPLVAQAGLTVQAASGGDGPLYVRADRHRLHQVFLNLLSNAVKFNRPGGAVTVSYAALPGDVVHIEVADNGLGIPEHRMPELFEPFNRLGAERTDVEGTGIGLAVTQRLVHAMGGTIGARSTFGEGSTFWVDLLQTAAPETHAGDGAGAAPQTVHLLPLHLLYVEDNLANLNLVTRLVERWPQVLLLTAMQGGIGLELAREHRPDLILLDLHLPDLRGDEVLARLREDQRTRGIPVVMLSADASPNRVQRLLDQGARAYLTKPLDLQAFMKLIDDVMREQHG